jgi:uncharacterized repeat protein (TIGR03803 family)
MRRACFPLLFALVFSLSTNLSHAQTYAEQAPYSFCIESECADGEIPYISLIQASDGNYYGTTYGGGVNNYGTIFKVTSAGALATVYNFCLLTECTDGRLC